MNPGILMVQGLVNSFGPIVMAAFAAAVKIDSFAYMPVQDFGNAFSTFVAQNYGAGKQERIREGARKSVLLVLGFCLVISASVFVFAKQLLLIFVQPYETEILAVGIQYLRIEGVFYFGIGFLFLFYGYYRAVRKPGMSVVLTVIVFGDTGSTGICIVSGSSDRGVRNLECSSDRMDSGGYCRMDLL